MACSTCFSQVNLQACTGCYHALYCSVECQQKDWLANHRAYCLIQARQRKRARLNQEEEEEDQLPFGYDPQNMLAALTQVIKNNPSMMRTFAKRLTLSDIRRLSSVSPEASELLMENNLLWWALLQERNGTDDPYNFNVRYFDEFSETVALTVIYSTYGFFPAWDNEFGQQLRAEYAEYTWQDVRVAGSWQSFIDLLVPSSVTNMDGRNVELSLFKHSVDGNEAIVRGGYFPLQLEPGQDFIRMEVERIFTHVNVNINLPRNLHKMYTNFDLDVEQLQFPLKDVLNRLARVGVLAGDMEVSGHAYDFMAGDRSMIQPRPLLLFNATHIQDVVDGMVEELGQQRSHEITVELFIK